MIHVLVDKNSVENGLGGTIVLVHVWILICRHSTMSCSLLKDRVSVMYFRAWADGDIADVTPPPSKVMYIRNYSRHGVRCNHSIAIVVNNNPFPLLYGHRHVVKSYCMLSLL